MESPVKLKLMKLFKNELFSLIRGNYDANGIFLLY